MSVIDAKRVADTAKEVSNEMVMAGKNPGVLLIDVCVEVVRRLYGLGQDTDGPEMSREEVIAKVQRAGQSMQTFVGAVTQAGGAFRVYPYVDSGREIVPIAATVTRTYRDQKGNQKEDFVPVCVILDQTDPVGFQARYRYYEPLITKP